MKICFFGSRSLSGPKVSQIINDQVKILGCTEIITALEPKGVCQEARSYAEENNIKLSAIPKQKDRAQGQFHHRSVKCYQLADYVVLIHDGVSDGTQNEFELALKMGMQSTYIVIPQTKQELSLPFKDFKI